MTPSMNIENKFRLAGCLSLAGLLSFAIIYGSPAPTTKPQAEQSVTQLPLDNTES